MGLFRASVLASFFLQNLKSAKAPDGRLGTPPVFSICAQLPADTTCPCESRMPFDLRELYCFFDLKKGISFMGPGLVSSVNWLMKPARYGTAVAARILPGVYFVWLN